MFGNDLGRNWLCVNVSQFKLSMLFVSINWKIHFL
jgi:hypothetical protein